MRTNQTDATFTFQTDEVSVKQWRSVMIACQAYEKCLLDGQRLSAQDFASKFPEIPQDLLTLELQRVLSEYSEDSVLDDSSSRKEYSQSARYLILEEIRSGGMGQVFRAFDRTCGRLVAIKRIRKELADEPEMKRRFLAEVELTADLEHPGVIPIYDQSIDADGREFYVMRLIHGDGTGTLQQAIGRFHSLGAPAGANAKQSWDSDKRAEFRKLIESVLVVADTTAYAHNHGIAHRDLKPSNILVGPYGETLIADWGLAKRIRIPGKAIEKNQPSPLLVSNLAENRSNWSSNAQGVGTPGFRAPETQSSSLTENLQAADIYSLGAILDCIITGSVQRRLESERRKNEYSIPTSILPLIAIARKAMSADVANRYQSARSMRMDLSNWLAGEPVSAYPESLAERVWKWPSRNRIAASAIASAAMIGLLGFGFFSWFQTVQKGKLSQALNTASVLLEESETAKRSTEEAFAQRESLALRAIIEFQSLLTLNPSLQSAPQFRVVREKVLLESRNFYESLAKSFDQSEKVDDESLGRLSDAALALVLLENELGYFSDAIQIAESACQRLRQFKRPSHRLEYQLGRILAFKGNIATRHGRKKQGKDDQEQAIRHLEPLLDSSELTHADRRDVASLWARAASPLAIGYAAKGDFESAKELLQKILSTLNARQPESFQDSLLKIQSYGNLAMVRYFSKDATGTYEALDYAEKSAARCAILMDESVPFREIVEFEVMRGTLVRFKSDLMLTEGKTDPAIEMQNQSLLHLTEAINKYPGNTEIQNAYQSCSNRLQAVLLENGRVPRAKELAKTWLELAQKLQLADAKNPKMQEFLMLAYHTNGHLNESIGDLPEAERSYREALSNGGSILSEASENESLLAQLMELNVHLIRFELIANRFEAAQSALEEAIDHATKLKSLPADNDQYRSGIKNQMEAALRLLQQSDQRDKIGAWNDRLRESGLMP